MISRLLYSLVLYLLVPVVLLRLLYRSLGNAAYWQRWVERFAFFKTPKLRSPIWVHAVSVGEVQAALPLIRSLQQQYPDNDLVVTTMTPTGSLRVRDLLGDEVFHVYLSYDLPGAVRRFLSKLQPCLALVMETELWPNLYRACNKRKIPVVVANARLSPRSAKGYAKLSSLVRHTLKDVTLIAAQSQADAERFQSLGARAEQVRVMGNIKFDAPLPEGVMEKGKQLRRQFGEDRPVWVAASTHEGEESLLLDAHEKLLHQYPHLLLVLVPRHPERFPKVASLVEQRGLKLLRRTHGGPCSPETEVFLGDTLGELPVFYAAGDCAFVGGSLVPVGGHNMLEPAVLGVPVLTGPYLHNFVEVSESMFMAGAALKVEDVPALVASLAALLDDPEGRAKMGRAGQQLVTESQGALNKLLDWIKPFLE